MTKEETERAIEGRGREGYMETGETETKSQRERESERKQRKGEQDTGRTKQREGKKGEKRQGASSARRTTTLPLESLICTCSSRFQKAE